MKAVKSKKGDIWCWSEDAIYFADDSYCSVAFDHQFHFIVGERKPFDLLNEEEWTALFPMLECRVSGQTATTGETSWGGCGFVGLRSLQSDGFDWMILLSTMNNPQKIWSVGSDIHVLTDLNYPDGIEIVIPSQFPERIRVANSVEPI